MSLRIRPATTEEMPALAAVMDAAIEELQRGFITPGMAGLVCTHCCSLLSLTPTNGHHDHTYLWIIVAPC